MNTDFLKRLKNDLHKFILQRNLKSYILYELQFK